MLLQYYIHPKKVCVFSFILLNQYATEPKMNNPKHLCVKICKEKCIIIYEVYIYMK